MFNLNDLFSASLTAAIAQMVTDEVTKATAPLMERIEKLESDIAEMDKTLGCVDSENPVFIEAVGTVIKEYDFTDIIAIEHAVESVLDTYEFTGRNFSEAVKDAMLDAIRR